RLDDVRPKHREFIGTLKSQDQILCSGPFTDSRGGALIVLQLDSSTTVEDVTTIMDGDLYWVEELIDKREIREWNPVINSFENYELLPSLSPCSPLCAQRFLHLISAATGSILFDLFQISKQCLQSDPKRILSKRIRCADLGVPTGDRVCPGSTSAP